MTERASVSPDLGAMLERLVDGRARVGWSEIDTASIPQLTSAEAAVVERAVPRRQAEFATGRRLLRSLVGRDIEILPTDSGAPRLPPGLVGSLAHDPAVVVGLVAPAKEMRAVGIDVEPVHHLGRGVAELIVRPDDVVPDALTAFVAKEAAYKVW